jgi:signal transduction histidine kinase
MREPQRRRTRRQTRCPLVLALVILSLPSCAPDRTNSAHAPVRQALALFTSGSTPPPDDAAWQARALPDDWSRTRAGSTGHAWYRLDLVRTETDTGLTVIYIPRANMAGIPYVNGVQLASAARLTDPISRLWYRPQLYWVPASLLHPGRNVIHYRMRSYARTQGGLSEVYIGTPDVLVPTWESHHFWQVTAMQLTTSITAALAVLALVAWAALRTQPAYGYFGLAALSWTVHGSLVLSTQIAAGLSVRAWETLIHSSLVWVVVDVALLVLLIVGGIEFKLLVDVARRTRSIESVLLVAAALLVLGLGVHDLLIRRGGTAFAEPFNLHFGVPVLFATVFWNLLGQVTAANRATKRLNEDLERRITEKAVELELSYAQLRRADAADARANERERIMRDMHDGVGSQLLVARQLAERGQLDASDVSALLDECIDDLRLMIDSLEPTQGDLVTVLGNLRYRLTDRLSRQGVALTWEVAELPLMDHLTPTDILHILRIVQESFANVLKHARANAVTFSASPSPDGRYAVLSVRDNGRGMRSGEPVSRGRGLANMNRRANALSGTFRLEATSTGGCEATLLLPVPAQTQVRAG